jgi:hypothetical protein
VSAALFKDGIQVTSTINGTVIELTTASLTEPTFFEVRVWQSLSDDSGFYPQSEVVTLVPGQVRTSSISLQPVPTITYTDQTMTFAASPENATTIFNGKPLRVGDVITAFDSSGVLCGVHLVKNAGLYAVVVTGDDPETVQDEGASAGEMISFKINNQSATVLSGNPIWNGGGGFPLIVELSASE